MQTVPFIRTTGFLIEGNSILVIKQKLQERSNWTFPGGRVEVGETLEKCLVREMYEETGIEVEVGPLLYICDRFKSLDHHVVDISFLIKRKKGKLYESSLSDNEEEKISELRMVPFSQMCELGFSEKLIRLLNEGLPHKGSYQGDFHVFYG